ncbi:unnamed protein product [Amoebophrya sp. A120]|nr:unnamed protein product [Amoebophrya sp. A120]|eukprot:GSA120T00005128001.1
MSRRAGGAGKKRKHADPLRLYEDLEDIMRREEMDFTFTLRALGDIVDIATVGDQSEECKKKKEDVEMSCALFNPKPFRRARGDQLTPLPQHLRKWLLRWSDSLQKHYSGAASDEDASHTHANYISPPAVARADMKASSPQVIPRNWMLTEAYEAAERGNFTKVDELKTLLKTPYEDVREDTQWVRATPEWAHGKAGISYMS